MNKLSAWTGRHFVTLIVAFTAGGFVFILAELLLERHWEGIQLVAPVSAGVGFVLGPGRLGDADHPPVPGGPPRRGHRLVHRLPDQHVGEGVDIAVHRPSDQPRGHRGPEQVVDPLHDALLDELVDAYRPGGR